MKNLRRGLMLSAASTALMLGASHGPALAFDTLGWSWEESISETSVAERDSWLWAFPDGQTTVDKLQVTVGSLSAEVGVGTQVTPPDLDGSSTTVTPLDASAELGVISGSASAFGNVEAVESEVPISARVGQFHVGGFDATAAGGDVVTTLTTLDTIAASTDGTDVNRDLMHEINQQAMLGMITPHQTTATAEATAATDVAVDVEAQAISNSATLSLAAKAPEPIALGEGGTLLDGGEATVHPLSTNAILGGDLTQYTYGDTAAVARSTQTLANFAGLGGLGQPVANVRASAIGNLGTTSVSIGDAVASGN